jgi:hypothetical protein
VEKRPELASHRQRSASGACDQSRDIGVIFHNDLEYSFTANGKTVLANGHFTDFVVADAPEVIEHGLSVQIRLPGTGLVVRDAGQFMLNFVEGTITFVRGPHPLLVAGGGSEGAAAVAVICAQLSA